MKESNGILAAALLYFDMGFSVIPIGENKKPLVAWTQYQNERATKEQIKKWFGGSAEVNIGVVTGKISNIVVVDVDTDKEINLQLPKTVKSKTGRGLHLFYKHPGQEVKNRAKITPEVDIRGDGGYVVMPPSRHENGNRYKWILSPEEIEFAELPQWIIETTKKEKVESNSPRNNQSDPSQDAVYEGKRNDTAAQVAGKLLLHLPPELWELGWFALKEWNQTVCKPSLPDAELRTTFESIKKRQIESTTNGNIPARARDIEAISITELMGTQFKNPKWLVENLIPHEGITIISGTPGCYKTWATLEIAIKVATGGKVFDEFQTNQSPVLIIDEENHLRIMKQRIEMLTKSLNLSNLPILISSQKGFLLEDGGAEKVVGFAKKNNIRFVIFDSLIRIHTADENVASEMRKVMKLLKDVANNGIAVIATHHHRKGRGNSNVSQEMRGSSEIHAHVDCHLAIERKHRETNVTFEQGKLREAQELDPFVVNFRTDGISAQFEYAGKSAKSQSIKESIKAAIKLVLNGMDKEPMQSELLASVKKLGINCGESTFKITVNEMVKSSELFARKGKRNSKHYSLKSFENEVV